jgi:hypothetical protein
MEKIPLNPPLTKGGRGDLKPVATKIEQNTSPKDKGFFIEWDNNTSIRSLRGSAE